MRRNIIGIVKCSKTLSVVVLLVFIAMMMAGVMNTVGGAVSIAAEDDRIEVKYFYDNHVLPVIRQKNWKTC